MGAQEAHRRKRNTLTALLASGVVVGMVGLSFAAVPLYRWVCQVAGFGGTTQVAAQPPAEAPILDREITVTLDANVNSGLPWAFQPLTRKITVRVGQEALVYYRATNRSDRPITGVSTFNVTPHKAGPYFAKIDCFCFTEQTLAAGESVDMPVVFFVDPEIAENRNLDDVTDISLSYTFFRAQGDREQSQARAATDAARQNL